MVKRYPGMQIYIEGVGTSAAPQFSHVSKSDDFHIFELLGATLSPNDVPNSKLLNEISVTKKIPV
jgi:hypothetical protein